MARTARAARAPTSSSSPSSSSPATRRRTSCSAPGSSAPRGARSRGSRRRRAGDGDGRRAAPRHRPLQRVLRARARRDPVRLPQALPAELRRVRRRPLLRAGRTTYFLLRFGDVLVGPTICEDIWQPGPPATDLALAGAQLDREHLGLAVPCRQGPRARGDAEGARDRQLVLRRALQRGRRTGRARSSTGTRSCSTTRARCSRAPPASRRSCSSSTSIRSPQSGAACATCAAARWRANAWSVPATEFELAPPREQTEPRAPGARAAARRPRADAACAGARAARLRDEERLRRRRDRPLRRDRLGADRRAVRRGARRRARARRLDAVALLVGGDAR